MVAFNFSPEFADAVASGAKRQTIRRTKRAKPGDALQLYTGQRTRKCRKLRDAVCEMVDYVGIRPDGLTVGNVEKHPRDIDDFARADGFKDYRDMVAWFEKKYGSPYFTGYVHRWTVWELKPRVESEGVASAETSREPSLTKNPTHQG